MNLATPEVLATVEDLYRTFAAYPLPKSTGPCPCCHSDYDDRQLYEAPLRKLSSARLRNYIDDALLTWGDVPTFKHFLPRIAELFVTSPDPDRELPDPEIIFSKLRYADWLSWPDPEQAAARHFLRAFWDAVLKDPPDGDELTNIESCLCSIAQAESDLQHYLDAWLSGHSLKKCVALSDFILNSGVMVRKKAGRNAFWADGQYEQVRAWIRSSAVKTKLKWAETQSSDSDLEEEFRAALSMLEMG